MKGSSTKQKARSITRGRRLFVRMRFSGSSVCKDRKIRAFAKIPGRSFAPVFVPLATTFRDSRFFCLTIVYIRFSKPKIVVVMKKIVLILVAMAFAGIVHQAEGATRRPRTAIVRIGGPRWHVGMRLAKRPDRCVVIRFRDVPYYYAAGVYYRKVGKEYEVILPRDRDAGSRTTRVWRSNHRDRRRHPFRLRRGNLQGRADKEGREIRSRRFME